MSDLSAHNEDILIKASKGDEEAFGQLFHMYWKKIFNVALKFTKSVSVSEELTQDVFLKIWIKKSELIHIKNVEAYLYTIARNHILNELRKCAKEQQFNEYLVNYFSTIDDLPEDRLHTKELQTLVTKAVDLLPARQRRIYYMSRNESLTHEEIAIRLQISKHTVKSHINKALAFIKRYLVMHEVLGCMLLCLLEFSHIRIVPSVFVACRSIFAQIFF